MGFSLSLFCFLNVCLSLPTEAQSGSAQAMCAMPDSSSASAQPSGEAALYIPSRDTVYALVVFVQHEDDTFRACGDTHLPTTDPTSDLSSQYDTYCAGASPNGRYQSATEDPATEWPAFRMVNGIPTQVRPDWAEQVIAVPGTHPSAYPSGSLSHFFWEMSQGTFKLEGRVYPDLIPITVLDSIPQGDMTLVTAEILAAIRAQPHGLDFHEFDRYDNYTGQYTPDTDGDGQPDGDGIFDMLIVMPRTGGGLAGLGSTSSDSLGGLIVNGSFLGGSGLYSAGFDFARQVAVAAHEVGHFLLGGTHPCDHDNSPTGTGSLTSLMCGPRHRRMDAPDRMRLDWLTPQLVTAPAGTVPLVLDPSPSAGHAVRITAAGTLGAGDVLVEARTFGNVWDGLPAIADGDLADQPFLVYEGVLVHQIGAPGATLNEADDRYSSMDNSGLLARRHLDFDAVHNAQVAGLVPPHAGYAPGEAFTPLSRFRFNFRGGPLDNRVALTDIAVTPSAVSLTLWGNYLTSPLSRTVRTNYTLSAESRARNDQWSFAGTLRFEPGPDTDEFPFTPPTAAVIVAEGGSFELHDVHAEFAGTPLAPMPFQFEAGARMVVTGGALFTDNATFARAADGPPMPWGGLRFVKNARSVLSRTVVSGVGGAEGGPLSETLVPGGVTVYGGAVELDSSFVQSNTSVAGVYVSGSGSEVNLLSGTVVQNNSGHGVRVADGGTARLSSGSFVTANTAGGVYASGKSAVAILDAADVSGNIGPGVTARSMGLAEFTPVRSTVGNNVGGLDAQAGGEIRAGLCLPFPGCEHLSNSFPFNHRPTASGSFDARSVTGSVVYAEGNTWGDAESARDLVLIDDPASFLSVEPVLTEIGARSVYRPSERGSEGEAARGGAAPLFALASRYLASGDTLAAGQAVVDALAGAETDDDRRAAFEAAARLFALAQPSALVDAAEAAVADSAAARPWALRALLVAQSEGKQPVQADATAATLAADYVGTEHEVVARAARVSLAVERDDEAAAVAALVALATDFPDADETAAVGAIVAAAYPGADVGEAFRSAARGAQTLAAPLADAKQAVDGAVVVGLARPNPTVGGAALTVSLPRTATVEAAVFDALGRRVATVASGEQAAGTQDLAIPVLAAGTYLVRVVVREAGQAPVVEVRRLTVVR